MTTVQIGVEDQTVSVRRNAAGKVAEFAFARSVPIEPGMVIAFDGSEQEHFEVTNVRGERIVAVRPRNWSVVEDQVTSGRVREVTVSPSEAGGGGHDSDGDMESRSSDGSDTEGSLVDFIASDPDSDEEEFGPDEEQDVEETPLTSEQEVQELQDEFPFDRKLLEETDQTGPRRSRRARKQVSRYVDDDYAEIMLADVSEDEAGAEEDSGDEEDDEEEEFDDDDYVHDDDEDDEDEDFSGSEEEEEDGDE